ncbi:MAG: 16S rRNA (guanine(527)-N(7))-methyltransferase RsmG [Kordia sp.]|nr:MAG: 16S rRNA (guanine(527)-N(7))-methyltransferase RsmG [Kordia sp.]
MEGIIKYFPDLTKSQLNQFAQLEGLYKDWNSKINVISRKDIDELYVRHVQHSLGIAKVVEFKPGASILDVGTGGGFPGIPLAILYPDVEFHLIDIIAKKLKVVQGVVDVLGLTNVKVEQTRAHLVDGKYDFIVSRAVTNMTDFVSWVRKKVKKDQNHDVRNGVFYLKGGDLTEELSLFQSVKITDLTDFFEEEFFETKKVVYLPIKYKP